MFVLPQAPSRPGWTAPRFLPPVMTVVFSGTRLLAPHLPTLPGLSPVVLLEKELSERPLSEQKTSFGNTV